MFSSSLVGLIASYGCAPVSSQAATVAEAKALVPESYVEDERSYAQWVRMLLKDKRWLTPELEVSSLYVLEGAQMGKEREPRRVRRVVFFIDLFRRWVQTHSIRPKPGAASASLQGIDILGIIEAQLRIGAVHILLSGGLAELHRLRDLEDQLKRNIDKEERVEVERISGFLDRLSSANIAMTLALLRSEFYRAAEEVPEVLKITVNGSPLSRDWGFDNELFSTVAQESFRGEGREFESRDIVARDKLSEGLNPSRGCVAPSPEEAEEFLLRLLAELQAYQTDPFPLRVHQGEGCFLPQLSAFGFHYYMSYPKVVLNASSSKQNKALHLIISDDVFYLRSTVPYCVKIPRDGFLPMSTSTFKSFLKLRHGRSPKGLVQHVLTDGGRFNDGDAQNAF